MKNEFQITRKLCQTWLWEAVRMPPKIYFSIFWVGFALLITAVCFTMQMEFLFVFALFCIYRAFFRDLLFSHRQYSLLAKNYGGEDWTRTVYFEENEIFSTDEGVKATTSYRIPYSDIVRIKEKDNKVWLVLRDKKVIRLYKDKFSGTSWEECRQFLEAKMAP